MEFPPHLKPSKSLSLRDDVSLSTAEESDETGSIEETISVLLKVCSSRSKESSTTVGSTRDGTTKTTLEDSESSSFCSIDDLDQRFEVMYDDYNDLESNNASVATFTDFTFDETGSFCAPSISVQKAILPQLLPGLLDDHSDGSEEAMVADSMAMGDPSAALSVVQRKALERSTSMCLEASCRRRDLLNCGSSSRRDLLLKQSTSHKNLLSARTCRVPTISQTGSRRDDLLARGMVVSSRRDLLQGQSTSYKNLSEESTDDTLPTPPSLLTRSASTAFRSNSRRSLLTRSASSVKRIQAV
eukprot:scaffold1069_cov155-Amphora_coffeaeformis.AAC.3